MRSKLLAVLSLLALSAASCGQSAAGDRASAQKPAEPVPSPSQESLGEFKSFRISVLTELREPWAMDFLPGTQSALITEKAGTLKLWEPGQSLRKVQGVPTVSYGGDGGLGDIKAAPDFATSRIVYLTWIEEGTGNKRGAVAGRARLVLEGEPRLEGLEVIWRQSPKAPGHGHYSHRMAFSPDGKYLYISSGDRRLMRPAQDPNSQLGKVLRIALAAQSLAPEVVSLGHRNMLGLKFDPQGRLWGLEHGPDGGDELNLIKPGANYGWPIVSEGRHYGGRAIPRHASRSEFVPPAISWDPVIAPGDFIFYTGSQWPEWAGQVLIAGLRSQAVIRVEIQGEKARELARYDMPNRVREIVQASDGAILILEDGPHGRLLRLSRK